MHRTSWEARSDGKEKSSGGWRRATWDPGAIRVRRVVPTRHRARRPGGAGAKDGSGVDVAEVSSAISSPRVAAIGFSLQRFPGRRGTPETRVSAPMVVRRVNRFESTEIRQSGMLRWGMEVGMGCAVYHNFVNFRPYLDYPKGIRTTYCVHASGQQKRGDFGNLGLQTSRETLYICRNSPLGRWRSRRRSNDGDLPLPCRP